MDIPSVTVGIVRRSRLVGPEGPFPGGWPDTEPFPPLPTQKRPGCPPWIDGASGLYGGSWLNAVKTNNFQMNLVLYT